MKVKSVNASVFWFGWSLEVWFKKMLCPISISILGGRGGDMGGGGQFGGMGGDLGGGGQFGGKGGNLDKLG